MPTPRGEIGRYRLIERIGRGGMGVVFRAIAEGPYDFERTVAVKVIAQATEKRATARERFVREARLAAMIHHPNVVQVTDFGEDDERLFLVMEWVDGSDLATLLQSRPADEPIAMDQAATILARLASAIGHLHTVKLSERTSSPNLDPGRDSDPGCGIIHRDISPSNVLIASTGSVKLGDFGVATLLDAAEHTRAPGKLPYLAPEVVDGERASPQSDLFALGVVAYELLVGERPWTNVARSTFDTHVAKKRAGVPPALDTLIASTLAFAPKDRIASAREFSRELRAIARTSGWFLAEEDLIDLVHEAREAAAEVGNEPTSLFTAERLVHTRDEPTPSALIGRDTELSRLKELLAEHRFVTIVGPPGIGKDALASGVLRQAQSTVTASVDASSLSGLDTIWAALALSLGIHDTVHAEAAVVDLIAESRASLLLCGIDRCVEQCESVVATLLKRLPGVQVLCTSRLRPEASAARLFELSNLPIAAADADLERVGAGMLLAARASAHTPSFELADDSRPDFRRLLDALGGNPLVLELAASRVAFLGVERASEYFSNEAASDASTEPDERLSQALIRSLEMLGEEATNVLGQCSVFEDGFDLAAAEAVVSLGDGASLVDVLHELWQHSLIERGTGHRFRLSRVVARHARKMLRDGGSREAVQARHAVYFGRLGDVIGQSVCPPEELRKANVEAGNLRAAAQFVPASLDTLRCALGWAELAHSRGEVGAFARTAEELLSTLTAPFESLARLHLALVRAWRVTGELSRSEDHLATLEAKFMTSAARGGYFHERGANALAQGDLDAAELRLKNAIVILEETRDTKDHARSHAEAMSSLGAVLAGKGNLEEARTQVERARDLYEALANARRVATMNAYLGNIALDLSDHSAAEVHLAEALSGHEDVGDAFGVAFALSNQSVLAHRRGRLVEAISGYDAATERFERLGVPRYAGAFIGYRGVAERELGKLDEAAQALQTAVDLLLKSGDQRFAALFRAHLGGVLSELGEYETATELFAAAQKAMAATQDVYLMLAVNLLAAGGARVRMGEAGEDTSEVDETIEACIARNRSERAPVERSTDLYFAMRATKRVLASEIRNRISLFDAILRTDAKDDGLVVGAEAGWFRPPSGERVDLERRPVLSRILMALVEHHRNHPDEALSRDALIDYAWPGEKLLRKSATNRMRVALSTLRKLGLSELIETAKSGYLIPSSVNVLDGGRETTP